MPVDGLIADAEKTDRRCIYLLFVGVEYLKMIDSDVPPVFDLHFSNIALIISKNLHRRRSKL
jgi:hypothetical protein